MHWKDLDVWKKSHELVKDVYKITVSLPKDELYGITSQLKRSAVSVPTNIVEGFSRNTTKEYIQFLFNSRGSLEEMRYLLFLVFDIKFINSKQYEKLESDCVGISKMLNALINNLKCKIK
ncbi:MAG: four helix bundle protein [Candidatus Omnitrophica bacterium]|nr:four helix bundle protein [Candidatus Omnitrophota bacterium]